jgi:hypothetical protein
MDFDLNTLADAYLRNFHSQNKDEDFWAWEEVHRIVGDDLDRGWTLTLLLLQKAESDDEMGYIAAGPVEDLIDIHGHKALDRIAEACHNNPRLQLALSTAGVLFYYEEFERWYVLLCRYGLRKVPLGSSSAVIEKVMHVMSCYLDETIPAGQYDRSMNELLNSPLDDKKAQRILQAAFYDVERSNNLIPPELRTPKMLRESELKTRVRQSLEELESLGYWAHEWLPKISITSVAEHPKLGIIAGNGRFPL